MVSFSAGFMIEMEGAEASSSFSEHDDIAVINTNAMLIK
jgi:hypothetical protein